MRTLIEELSPVDNRNIDTTLFAYNSIAQAQIQAEYEESLKHANRRKRSDKTLKCVILTRDIRSNVRNIRRMLQPDPNNRGFVVPQTIESTSTGGPRVQFRTDLSTKVMDYRSIELSIRKHRASIGDFADKWVYWINIFNFQSPTRDMTWTQRNPQKTY